MSELEKTQAGQEASANGATADEAQAAAQAQRESVVMAKIGSVLGEYCLSPIGKAAAMTYLRRLGDEDMSRVRGWWLRRLNGRELSPPESSSNWQRGCPELIEGLRAQPVWWRGDPSAEPPAELAWVRDLEAAAPAIREELLALRDAERDGFQPYRSPKGGLGGDAGCAEEEESGADALGKKGTSAGAWNVFYLQLHNVDFAANRARCPQTCATLDALPRVYGHTFFSAVAPASHISAHYGPTAKKLRCHLPLVSPAVPSRLRIADETLELREGRAVVFDDSFEHEAWNDDPASARIVLIVDVWHPDLSAKEIKFLGFLQTAAMRRDKNLCDRAGDSENFYAVIDKARHVAPDRAQIWS